jgi:hypothetical protein
MSGSRLQNRLALCTTLDTNQGPLTLMPADAPTMRSLGALSDDHQTLGGWSGIFAGLDLDPIMAG